MKQTKKGFTLVELLVVIAILAILATVSVVGYTSFIQKAHESNDKSLVAQLNLAVTRVDGKEYESMYDVVNAVKEQGFDVAKMQATAADQAILWDMDAQEFFYSADGQHEGANVWVVSDEVSETYNTYYIGGNSIDSDTTTSICIATEGGNLSIDAANANVEHYGEVGDVNIEAVANNSYHEFGRVTGIATVASGRVVVEESGVIGTIIVNSVEKNQVTLEGSFGAVIAQGSVEYKTENFEATAITNATEGEINGSAICNTTTGEFYTTFEEAFEQSGTLLLLQKVDISLKEGYTIDSGKTFVLDLNGHEIKCEADISSEFALIANNGSLTIKDSVGGGKISVHANSPDLDVSPDYVSNAITNCGTLVIEGGLIENTTVEGAACAYCVDNRSGSSFTMNGGELVSAFDTVRVWGGSEALNVTITGGTITGTGSAIWLQMDASASTVNLTITGGTFNDLNKDDNWGAIHFGGYYARDYSNVSISIIGGTVDGDIYFQALAHTGATKANIQVKDVNVSGEIVYDTDGDHYNN